MGLVTKFFIKPFKRTLLQPPAGSFLIHRNGEIFSSTMPPTFSQEHLRYVGARILAAFGEAASAELGLRELFFHYPTFKVQAKHLPSGALVYLIPLDKEFAGESSPTPADSSD